MECRYCKHHSSLPESDNLQCVHPDAGGPERFATLLRISLGQESRLMKRMGVTLDSHGVERGTAYWPIDFNPVWVKSCKGFEK